MNNRLAALLALLFAIIIAATVYECAGHPLPEWRTTNGR